MAGFGFSPGTMSAYHPTLRDRAATSILDLIGHGPVAQNLVTGILGSRGLGTEKLGIADFIPGVGQAFQADEAGRQMASGHPVAGAANLALAAIPVPAAVSAAKSAFGFAAKPVARALEGVGGKAVAEAAQTAASDVGKAAAPIIAYHGSPHAFDKFDTAKIGTGEGAQAYGHGLYFAENEKTAKAYRDQLAGYLVNGRDPNDGEAYAIQALEAAGGDPKRALAMHEDAKRQYPGWNSPEGQKTLEQWAEQGAPAITSPGHTYQVGINAHPDHFLDWDAPLSRDYVEQKLGNFPEVLQADAARRSFLGPEKGFTGRDVYAKLAGWNPSGAPSPAAGTGAEASAKLAQAGIPGIKYLDQGSRTAGDGTRNYVVFNPEHIDILKRYGIPATVMGGAGAAAAGAQQQQQPQGF